MINFYPC